jgi:hypothetical protein
MRPLPHDVCLRTSVARAARAFACASTLLATTFAVGCSGDGKASPTDPRNPGDTTTTVTPTEIEKTAALLDTLTRAVNALPHRLGTRSAARIAAILRAGKGVTHVQVLADSNVVALLPGNLPVTFITYAMRDSTSPGYPVGEPDTIPIEEALVANAARREVQRPPTADASAAPDIAIPSPGKVLYLQTLGPKYTVGDISHEGLFLVGKYANVSSPDPSIDQLKHITDVDVLWMQSHSGPAYKKFIGGGDPDVTFAVWTSSDFNPLSYVFNKSLIDDNLAAVMCATYNFKEADNPDTADNQCHFAIMPDFIRKFKWTFREGAMVLLTACSVGTPSAGDFRAALFESGAASILAWTGPVSSDAGQVAANLAVDWMLGSNFVRPVSSVKYRPFLWTVVKRTLDSLGYTKIVLPPYLGSFGFTELKLFTDEAKYNNATLNTAISSVSVNADNQRLTLLGAFGPDPGAGNRRVVIGSRSVTPTSWSTFAVEAPIQGSDGGDVFVESTHAGGATRTTNVRSLTRWTGLISYVKRVYGVLEDALSVRPVFRGDVGTYWSAPRGRLKRNTLTYMGVPGYMMTADSGSTCNVSTGGTYTVGDVYEEAWTQSAAGDVPVSKSTTFGCAATLFVPSKESATGGKLAVYAQSSRLKVRRVTTTSADGTKSTTTTTETLIFPMSNVMGGTGVIGPNVQSNAGFNLFGGTRSASSGDGFTTYTFTWSPFTAQFVTSDNRPR